MSTSTEIDRVIKGFYCMFDPTVFPEIPLFHVLNARITFGNIFASDESAPNVQCIGDGTEAGPLCCVVDDTCFDAPPSYLLMGEWGTFHILKH